MTVQTISVPGMVVLRDGIARGDGPCHISGNFCYVTWKKRLNFCRDFLKSKWLIYLVLSLTVFLMLKDPGLEKTSAEFWQNHEYSWSYLYNWLSCLFSVPATFFMLVFEQGTQIKEVLVRMGSNKCETIAKISSGLQHWQLILIWFV